MVPPEIGGRVRSNISNMPQPKAGPCSAELINFSISSTVTAFHSLVMSTCAEHIVRSSTTAVLGSQCMIQCDMQQLYQVKAATQ